MQKDDPVNRIERESVWRGRMTPEERRQLEVWRAAHPDEQGVVEAEMALTRLLTRLPDAAAPSNLTARVLEAIDRPVRASEPAVRVGGLGWLRGVGWLPRLAGVAVLVMVGYIGHHQYKVATHRAEVARTVAEVSELATTVPSIEALQDFEAIRNLESAATPDVELLALLQ